MMGTPDPIEALAKLAQIAGPPAAIAAILFLVQVQVISKVADRKKRTMLVYLTTGIQSVALVAWLAAWALGTF